MTFKHPSLALQWDTGVSLSLLSVGGLKIMLLTPRVYGTFPFLRALPLSEGILSPEQQMFR